MEKTLLLVVSLAILPALYLALCHWMEKTVQYPPRMAFFIIFGSIGGYLLLCALLMPSPAGVVAVLAFMIVAYAALVFVMISTIQARPRTGFHLVAAGISGLFVAAPLIMIAAHSGS